MATHFTGPVLNKDRTDGSDTDPRGWYSKLPLSEDPAYVTWMNDFTQSQDYAAADWTITTTEAGAGSATEALAVNELNGALLITNAAGDDDLDSLQQNEETWKCASGKRLWYETRIKTSDATETDIFVGLVITDTTPLDTADRIGFEKNDGDALIDALTEKNSTETKTASVHTMVDDTYVKLAIYWDGVSTTRFYVNDNLKATHTTNVPDDVNLAVTMHLQNGEAVAKTMTIDYIYVTMER